MYKVMRCWIFIVIACLFFVGSFGFAEGKPKGQGDSPSGWGKGEKKGWHSDEPPGSDKGEKRKKVKKGKKEKKKKYKGEDDGSSDDNRHDYDGIHRGNDKEDRHEDKGMHKSEGKKKIKHNKEIK